MNYLKCLIPFYGVFFVLFILDSILDDKHSYNTYDMKELRENCDNKIAEKLSCLMIAFASFFISFIALLKIFFN